MRKHFVETVLSLMSSDKEIVLLTADLGFGSFEVISEKFPGRYYNVGIAEQNMVGMACGLSLQGKKVIIYSIANFTTLRVVEQIRNYLLYHSCQVLIVNGGGGFSYGQLGYTHYGTEDVTVMMALQEMEVYAPFNQITIENSIREWHAGGKTAYLRLEKNDIQIEGQIRYFSGFALVGDDNAKNIAIGYGSICETLISAQKKLADASNLSLKLILLYRLKNTQDYYELLRNCNKLLIVEENSRQGGLGVNILAGCMLRSISPRECNHLGILDTICPTIGDQNYMRAWHKMSCQDILAYFNAE